MIPKFSVKKPFTVLVAVVLVILLGIISFTKMSTDLLPNLDLPYAVVITTYPGASPEKIESNVTKPLENVLATTSGIKNIQSASSENSSMIFLEFEQGTNMESAIIEMNSNVDMAEAYFEDEVSAPMIMKLDPDMMPVMVSSIDMDGKDIKEISSLLNDEIMPEFEKIDGVASVSTMGLLEEQVSVELNDDKIKAVNSKIKNSIDKQFADAEKKINDGLTQVNAAKQQYGDAVYQLDPTLKDTETQLNAGLEDLNKQKETAYASADIGKYITSDMMKNIITADNFSMPAGYITEDAQQYIVKVGESFQSVDEIKSLELINMDIDGVDPVKLEDVADVEMINNADDMYAKINGNDGIILMFQKQSTASTAEVAHKINDVFNDLRDKYDGLHITALEDQGQYIDLVVNSVIENLLMGGALAILILLLFLRNFRTTLIIGLSIPISLMFALVLMYFSGITLNVISLAGLALGVGMLVDNSIVVIENTYRMRSEGMSAFKAAVNGAKQVSGALMSSTLTTICVFLPIVFTEGISRQLFTDMGLTIAFSLIASLIVALTLVPVLASGVLKKGVTKQHKLFEKFADFYGRILEKSLHLKPVVIIFVVALLGLSIFGATKMGTAFIPEVDSPQMSITVTMPEEASVKDAREMSNTVMDKISGIEEIDTIGAIQGVNTMTGLTNSSNTTVSMYVLLKEDRDKTSQEVARIIEDKTSDLDCKLSVQASTMDMSAMGGSGISIVVKGNDFEQLKKISADIAKILEQTDGTKDIDDGFKKMDKQTMIIVDKNKAMSHQLTVAQVYASVAAYIKTEDKVTTLTESSKDYPVIMLNKDTDNTTREGLKKIEVEAADGTKVKLTDIAEVTDQEGLQSINHDNQSRTIYVSAAIDDDHNIGLVSRDFQEKLDKYDVPDGYSVTLSGENETINDAIKDLILMVLLAIVLIYGIMVAEFQSLLSPFIVMFTIPLAFTGGLLALMITGMEISVISMLGFLVLAGIVVNNGIVFVDYVNQLRQGGMEKKEALILAGKTRLRPILMTAITTILGLSTMALGIGSGADMIQPLAVVAIGGLIYATLLTLFIVPVMYDIFNRRKQMRTIEVED